MTPAARARLITGHLALVRALARRASRRWHRVALDDLVAAGQYGLVDAAQRFDPAAGRADFAAFARRRIWGAMIDEVRQGGLVGGPYRPGRSYEAAYLSLDETDAAGDRVIDLPSGAPSPEACCVARAARRAGHALLRRGLARLAACDRALLIARYGRGETFRAMGQRRACSESVMWRRHAVVLARLRGACGVARTRKETP